MKLFGVNYIDYQTHSWPPNPWQDFNPERLKEDFELISKMRLKLIRIFLTAYSFLPTVNTVNDRSLEKLNLLLEIAKDFGLKVILTGPDLWEGWPSWVSSNRYTDSKMIEGLAVFWETIAREFSRSETIFAWDILNEPDIEYKGPTEGKEAIYQYQKHREQTATEWIRFQSGIIKKYDNTHPVTLGLIQRAFPLQKAKSKNPLGYNPFQPRNLAPYLDFISIHFYPNLSVQNFFEDNLELLLAWIAYAMDSDKPVHIQEFGMWGGGAPQQKPFASEEQQKNWGLAVLENTFNLVECWLNWPFIDISVARDISLFTGLIDKNRKVKKWGKTFSEVALGKRLIRHKHRKIVPLHLNEKNIISKTSVDKELKELIEKQKKEGVICQVVLD